MDLIKTCMFVSLLLSSKNHTSFTNAQTLNKQMKDYKWDMIKQHDIADVTSLGIHHVDANPILTILHQWLHSPPSDLALGPSLMKVKIFRSMSSCTLVLNRLQSSIEFSIYPSWNAYEALGLYLGPYGKTTSGNSFGIMTPRRTR